MSKLPILYSFRRCPYAMRARMALSYSGVEVVLREIELKNKPPEMLAASNKGTVPVLVLSDGHVIDESRDIITWALTQNDPDQWTPQQAERVGEANRLVDQNDGEFKGFLDRYKYADRYPDRSEEYYRTQGELFLKQLDEKLQLNKYLLGDNISVADVAIMPFIRQFAHVNKRWFEQTEYRALQAWLDAFLMSDLFTSIMKKYKPWAPSEAPVYLP